MLNSANPAPPVNKSPQSHSDFLSVKHPYWFSFIYMRPFPLPTQHHCLRISARLAEELQMEKHTSTSLNIPYFSANLSSQVRLFSPKYTRFPLHRTSMCPATLYVFFYFHQFNQSKCQITLATVSQRSPNRLLKNWCHVDQISLVWFFQTA